jgi:hypothetical protein
MLVICVTIVFLPVVCAFAQDTGGAINVALTAEYDIGFDCPTSAALDPDNAIFWVQMDNCALGNYSLRGFSVVDGTPVTSDESSFVEALSPLESGYFFANTTPLAVSDDMIDILYKDSESYETMNLRESRTSDTAVDSNAIILTYETVNEFAPDYSGYLETTTYNMDHTMAVVIDTPRFHVIDLLTGVEFFTIDDEDGHTFGTFLTFSPDGTQLHMVRFDEPENVDNLTATVTVYSLPGGEIIGTYAAPSGFVGISPNNELATARRLMISW